jgi:hypothetical protein
VHLADVAVLREPLPERLVREVLVDDLLVQVDGVVRGLAVDVQRLAVGRLLDLDDGEVEILLRD